MGKRERHGDSQPHKHSKHTLTPQTSDGSSRRTTRWAKVDATAAAATAATAGATASPQIVAVVASVLSTAQGSSLSASTGARTAAPVTAVLRQSKEHALLALGCCAFFVSACAKSWPSTTMSPL